MRLQLLPHPANPCAAEVTVDLRAAGAALQIVWEMRSCLPILRPPPAADRGQRRDGLWRHTCGELFAFDRRHPGPYLEFNFSPADAWAAYAFDGPRRGMRPHDWGGAPLITIEPLAPSAAAGGDVLRLRAALPLHACGDCRALAPTAVLATGAGLGYFALRHPPGEPDFHGGGEAGNFAAAIDLPAPTDRSPLRQRPQPAR